jgi:bifunctional non-homologous end joining protein LigD
MLKSPFEPCIPSGAKSVPDRPEWIHEIKHDSYRLIVQREGKRVRLWTRDDHDWSGRFPLITEAALRNRNSSFVLDGEAVLLGVDGRSDFNGLHSRRHDAEVGFYAFDILVSDGEDVRRLPLSMRKANLFRLLARRVDGIHLRLRARRNWPRSFPACLPARAGGHGLQAPRERVSRRQVPALDQGQEPAASSVQPRAGSVLKRKPSHNYVHFWTDALGQCVSAAFLLPARGAPRLLRARGRRGLSTGSIPRVQNQF